MKRSKSIKSDQDHGDIQTKRKKKKDKDLEDEANLLKKSNHSKKIKKSD